MGRAFRHILVFAVLAAACGRFAAQTAAAQSLTSQNDVRLPASVTVIEPGPSPVGVSVRENGAIGDGTADDTTAFESAINKAKTRNEPVVVPAGTYRLTRTLVLSQQALVGSVCGTWNADSSSLPTIKVECTSGPCIRLESGGSVRGLLFSYSWGGQSPSARPPTIELAGTGCRVSDVKISSTWDGIMADGTSDVSHTTIERVFLVNVHNVGVRLLGSTGCSRISKVESWSPSSSTFPTSGVGFLMGKNDVLEMSDCFVFNAHVGYRFVNSIDGCAITGGSYGTLSNCTADLSSFGVKVEGQHGLSFAGGTFWTHWGGMVVSGSGGKVRMSGLELRANGGPALTVSGGDLVTITGSLLRRNASGFTAPALRVTGGGATVVTGCVLLCSSSPKTEITSGLLNVVVADNVIK